VKDSTTQSTKPSALCCASQSCNLPTMPQPRHHPPASPARADWSSVAGPLLAGPLLAGPLLAACRKAQLLLALLRRILRCKLPLPPEGLMPAAAPLFAPPALLAVSQGSGGAEIFRFEKSRPGGMTRMMGK
jgi:hypothetical protein